MYRSADVLAAVRDGRRQRVSELLVRGFTHAQITQLLSEDEQYFNPYSGKPWNSGTISSDASYLRDKWQRSALCNYDVHVGRILAQIREVRRQAWKIMDFKVILRSIDQEVKLLGLDKATKVEIDWRQEMRNAGVDPSTQFEKFVQEAYEDVIKNQEVTNGT